MAIRVDAAGDGLTRTTNLPSISAFTMMGWFYLVNAPASGTWNTPFMIGTTTSGQWFGLQIQGPSGSTIFDIWANGGDAVGTTIISIGAWHHYALTYDGTTLRAYLDGTQECTFAGGPGALSSQVMKFGHDIETPDEHIDGRMMAIKVWSAALSAAEVASEMQTILPKRLANLNTFTPGFPGSGERARDYSGVGGNWTEDGTLTDEDPAPISWGGRIITPMRPAAGTPANTQTRKGVFDLWALLEPGSWAA